MTAAVRCCERGRADRVWWPTASRVLPGRVGDGACTWTAGDTRRRSASLGDRRHYVIIPTSVGHRTCRRQRDADHRGDRPHRAAERYLAVRGHSGALAVLRARRARTGRDLTVRHGRRGGHGRGGATRHGPRGTLRRVGWDGSHYRGLSINDSTDTAGGTSRRRAPTFKGPNSWSARRAAQVDTTRPGRTRASKTTTSTRTRMSSTPAATTRPRGLRHEKGPYAAPSASPTALSPAPWNAPWRRVLRRVRQGDTFRTRTSANPPWP